MGRLSPHFWLAGICAIVFFLFLVHRVEWVKPLKPRPRYSTISKRLERDEVESAMKSLLSRYRSTTRSLEHNDFFYPGLGRGLGWGIQFGTVQARILALCYPQETEAFALRILGDREAEKIDLQFATRVLGVLSSEGIKSAQAMLLRLAKGEDRGLMGIALQSVSRIDRDGAFRILYLAACKNGVLDVYDLGPFWSDQETRRTFEEILATQLKKYDHDYYSTEVLERIGILGSPKRATLLEQLVDGAPLSATWTPGWSDERQRWALAVILGNPTPHALEALRRRLDREEARFAEFDRTVMRVSPTHPGWTQTSDYDDYLLAYWSLGGKPNTVESERLGYYGYLDDPGARLAALMSHW